MIIKGIVFRIDTDETAPTLSNFAAKAHTGEPDDDHSELWRGVASSARVIAQLAQQMAEPKSDTASSAPHTAPEASATP